MPKLRPVLLAAFAAPLALALAACGDSAEGPTSGEAIARVAPPAGQQWTDVVARTPEGGWLVGNPQAPIKLVEYGSLTCPGCAYFSQTGMQPLREEYVNSGRVSLELRSVPIHGAVDLVLTRLLECAPKEAAPLLAEQLWANLNAVLTPIQANEAALQQAMTLPENQRFVAYAQQGGLLEFFAARGISTEQAQQCLSDFAAIQALAERMQNQANEDGVNSTPTFHLNGTAVDETSWEELEAALQRAGAR
jgi:protein-disulfide isomerase